MRIFGIFAAIFLVCIAVNGQAAERWNELILDEATPEQAIAIYGRPRIYRDSTLHVYDIQPLLSADTAKRNFEVGEWENAKGHKSIMLTFSSDDKLRMIFATPDNEGTKTLENLCGGNWKPAGQDLVKDFRAEMSANPKPVPTVPITKKWYQVYALTPRAFCVSDILNEIPNSALPIIPVYPGRVGIITMVSRAVESKVKPKAPAKNHPANLK
ncbi:MAG TPA: hypothetical protein PLL77_03980 [Pyrinomonadaceae bacterium]|nr:hypothetical protein [Pyrinomonadaceae bacterium]